MNNFELINTLKQIQLADRNKKLAITFGTIALIGLAGTAVFYIKYLKAADNLLMYKNKFHEGLKEKAKQNKSETQNLEANNETETNLSYSNVENL